MTGGARPHLSLVIPAYNEARRLPATVRRVADFGEAYAAPVEVLVVVERSADGTLDLAREAARGRAAVEVIDNGAQRGKGHAVRSGMLRARGELALYMDADLSVPLEDVAAFAEHFRAHPAVDVLVGNRQHAGSEILRRQTWLRERMGRTFNRVLRALSLVELRDTQCGFKAFRARAARRIFSRQRLDGFAFDVEVLLLAQALGHEVADLPVRWVNSPESRVGMVRDSARMLADAARVRSLVAETMRAHPAHEDA